MSKRLFFALELPAVCREALARIDPRIRGMRWGREENFHITLSFLGSLDAAEEERLREAVADVRVPPFFLPLRGVGSFGGGRPSVLWAGVGNGHPHLFALHKHLQDAVLRAGLKPDLRAFHPHVTLARPRGISASALRPFLREHAETEFGMWEVKEFVLFSSDLDPAGSTYTAEMRCGLS
jgi:2'-5' RNA ligase